MDCSTPGSLSSAIFQSFLRFMSIESVMLYKHLILCRPLLLLPSIFPSIRVFPNESALTSGGQSIGASAAVLPMKDCMKMAIVAAAAAAKSLQLCPTLCNPIDGSPPGTAIPGILQARTLKWVAISFSNNIK